MGDIADKAPHPAASRVFDGKQQIRFDDLKDQEQEVAVCGVRLLHFNQLRPESERGQSVMGISRDLVAVPHGEAIMVKKTTVIKIASCGRRWPADVAESMMAHAVQA